MAYFADVYYFYCIIHGINDPVITYPEPAKVTGPF
jgi:hypothetical protein